MISGLLSAAALGGLAATLLGDATIGATVGGIFSVLNTLINAYLVRKVRHVHDDTRQTQRILAAPRRAIYNDQGRVVGTMLKLETDEPWTGTILPPQRGEDMEGGER